MRLADKVAVVTGGGSGLEKASRIRSRAKAPA